MGWKCKSIVVYQVTTGALARLSGEDCGHPAATASSMQQSEKKRAIARLNAPRACEGAEDVASASTQVRGEGF